MQTLKSLSVLCAIGLCATSISNAAPDNWAQARAREALEQKLRELQSPPPANPSAPAATPSVGVQPSPAPAPAPRPILEPAPVPVVPTLAPARPPAALPVFVPESADITRLREALRQKLNELNAQTRPAPAAPVAPQVPMTPAPPVAPAAVPPPAVVTLPALSVPAEGRPADPALQEAMRQKMSELNAQQKAAPPAPRAKTSAIKPAPVPAPAVARTQKTKAPKKSKMAAPEFKPIQAPPLPISASKEARLAELLRRYKADEITPEQYQAERARIRAEP